MNTTETLRGLKIDGLSTKNNDMRGRRTINASPSVDTTDYIIQKELNDAITAINASIAAINTTQSTGPVATSTSHTYSLFKFNTLAIQSDATPNILIINSASATVATTAVTATVKQAPIGADLTIKIYLGSNLVSAWLTLKILDGTKSIVATPTQIGSLPAISANDFWRVDITTVGSTFGGSDLVVTITI